jgi:tetratricopeptide (TPR) repeat protein
VTGLSASRRAVLTLAALTVSVLLLRAQLADALVVRGDEFLYRSQPDRALRYYSRALALDALSARALDRFLFVATTSRNRLAMRDGIVRATAYLASHPEDDVILMDRAMAFRATRDFDRAASDFAVVGFQDRDARALTFAGFSAFAAGQLARATRLWRAALAVQPKFPPARHALERLDEAR